MLISEISTFKMYGNVYVIYINFQKTLDFCENVKGTM